LPPRVDLQAISGVPCELLVGGKCFSPGAGEEGPFYQTAFLIRPDGAIAGRYFKRTLMPMGEYIPGQALIPGLRKMANLDEVYSSGNDCRPLELKCGARIGVLLCYEDMVAEDVRASVAQGAEVLISLCNGSAFENPLALEQQLLLSRLRAVENRRCFARCTATGVSCVIAPTGRILSRLETNDEGVLDARLPLLNELTIYNRFGHCLPLACLLTSAALVLSSLVPRLVRYCVGRREDCQSPSP
jgi:apolipoprotein N-acyltransferase